MKKIILPTLPFLIFPAVFAFVAWCGGYDFDARNSDVGFAAATALILAAISSFSIVMLIKQMEP
jgi:hypothetical protein